MCCHGPEFIELEYWPTSLVETSILFLMRGVLQRMLHRREIRLMVR